MAVDLDPASLPTAKATSMEQPIREDWDSEQYLNFRQMASVAGTSPCSTALVEGRTGEIFMEPLTMVARMDRVSYSSSVRRRQAGRKPSSTVLLVGRIAIRSAV